MKSTNGSIVEGCVLSAGVCCRINAMGSTEIPSRAFCALTSPTVSMVSPAKGLMLTSVGLTLDILNMALGFSLEMYPSSCQAISVPTDQPKYIEPPKPSANGTWPVRNTTMWCIPSTCSSVKKN